MKEGTNVKTQSVICSQQRARMELDKTTTKTEEAASNVADPWASLCAWLTSTFRGIEGSLERIKRDGSRVVEFQDRSLVSMRAYVQANGVPAIGLTFSTKGYRQLREITGVKAIHLERDAAGFPTAVEFVSEVERVVLRFTGSTATAPAYSRNS